MTALPPLLRARPQGGNAQQAVYERRNTLQRRRASALIAEDGRSAGAEEQSLSIDLRLPDCGAGAISALTAGFNVRGRQREPADVPLPAVQHRPLSRAVLPPALQRDRPASQRKAAGLSVGSGALGDGFREAQRRFFNTLDDINECQRMRARLAAGAGDAEDEPSVAAKLEPRLRQVRSIRMVARSLGSKLTAAVAPTKAPAAAVSRRAAAGNRQRERKRVTLQVDRRIRALRGDSAAWERFNAGIQGLLRERERVRQLRIASVAERRRVPLSPSEKSARARERAGLWDERHERALLVREQQWKDFDEMQIADQSPSPSPRAAPAGPSHADIQRAWGAAVAQGARMRFLLLRREEEESIQEVVRKAAVVAQRRRAALVLQLWWRQRLGRREHLTQQRAKRVIVRRVTEYLMRLREKKKPRHCARIAHFLRLYQRVYRLQHQYRLLLRGCIRGQRIYRRGVVIVRARMHMLRLQAERGIAERLQRAERECVRCRENCLPAVPAREEVAPPGRGRTQAKVRVPAQDALRGVQQSAAAQDAAWRACAEAELARRRLEAIQTDVLLAGLRNELRITQRQHRKRLLQYCDKMKEWAVLKRLRQTHFTTESLVERFCSAVQLTSIAGSPRRKPGDGPADARQSLRPSRRDPLPWKSVVPAASAAASARPVPPVFPLLLPPARLSALIERCAVAAQATLEHSDPEPLVRMMSSHETQKYKRAQSRRVLR